MGESGHRRGFPARTVPDGATRPGTSLAHGRATTDSEEQGPMIPDPVKAVLAGAAATLPMSVFMQAAHRRLPWTQRYQLPPRQITDRLLRKSRLDRHLSDRQQLAATWASHFA